MRRNVRLIRTASANPAPYAASPSDAPDARAALARSNFTQRRYGRSGIPTVSVNACMKRPGDSRAWVALEAAVAVLLRHC